MPVRGYPVNRGVCKANDRRRVDLTGEAEREIMLPLLWYRSGGGFVAGPLEDPSWVWERI